MSEVHLDDILKNAEQIIVEAGSIIEASWKSGFVSYTKDVADIVTDIDIKVEQYIRNHLAQLTPQFGFIVEEGVSDLNHEYNWSIDPIDGTKYFAKRVPMFYTQIALLKKKIPLYSLTYQPISHQLFSARKNAGAHLNNVRLTAPTAVLPLERSIIDIDTGDLKIKENAWKRNLMSKLGENCYRLRLSGGYLGPALATDAIQAYINTDLSKSPSTKNIVDLAPHQLLIEEVGYTTTVYDRFPQSVLIWALPETTKHIIALLDELTSN